MPEACSVSILVPVYNVQKYLRQCLDSLTDQTMQDIQIICINDGSTDLSLSILEEYARRDSRIEIISKPNSGYGNTMNRGLAAARGKYVGIVESDDFAEKDMFERLFAVVEEHDADIVKSNFYTHITTDPLDKDCFVENLDICEYDQPFCPRNDQRVFLIRPAIWSALYKREFLEREKISFLETPGASFQDTSFNFKAFALANRAVLVKDAYLHYRIDNENSSVKSLSKVFCVCDEYKEMWEFIRARPLVFDALKYRLPQIQLGGFLWNLERLTPGLQHDFYVRLVEEFQAFESEGLLRQDIFDAGAWNTVSSIVSNPEEHFLNHYGPIEVSRTSIVFVSERAKDSCERIVSDLLDALGVNDELYLCLDATVKRPDDVERKLAISDPRFHIAEGQVESVVANSIDMDQIRGSELFIAEVGGPAYTRKTLPAFLDAAKETLKTGASCCTDSWAIGSWSVEDLRKLNLPIWAPLLFAGYYQGENREIENVPSWVLNDDLPKEQPTLKEVQSAYDSFKLLYTASEEKSKHASYADRKRTFNLFSRLWGRVQSSYDQLGYDDRVKFGERPSPLSFAPLIMGDADAFACDEVTVSVVVPVYNVEKYIAECLDSILRQDLPSLQVICVNDSSSDASLDVIEEYAKKDGRILVVSQFNGGAGSARNRGIEFAFGEYIAFIDPDDYYPEDSTLRKLISAAREHDALICGGSFRMLYPDGSKKDHFGGEQFFYTVRNEGFYSFAGTQTDYGWIRFLYHRSVFDEGKVRFPENRWYEDPVFLVRVMSFCDRYYAITDAVYEYRVEHKETSWNVVKVRDMVKGIASNLSFARERRLATLYTTLILRLNRDYYEPIMKFISDEEVFTTLVSIQGAIDLSLVNDVQENEWKSYLIKPLFDFKNASGTAVVRLAKRVQGTSFYKMLQALRSKR